MVSVPAIPHLNAIPPWSQSPFSAGSVKATMPLNRPYAWSALIILLAAGLFIFFENIAEKGEVPPTPPVQSAGSHEMPTSASRTSRNSYFAPPSPIPTIALSVAGQHPGSRIDLIPGMRGSETPQQALESLHFALKGIDRDAVSRLILLPTDAMTKLQQIIDRLPDEMKREYPTPETYVATFMCTGQEIEAAAITSPIEIDGNNAIFSVEYKFSNESGARHDKIAMVKVDSGWRYPVQARMIAQIIAYINHPKD